MLRILVILPAQGCRNWQVELAKRLEALGHHVGIAHAAASARAPLGFDAVLALESRLRGNALASRCEPLAAADLEEPDLVIDLASAGHGRGKPVLRLTFCGCNGFPEGLSRVVAGGKLATLTASIDGKIVADARPMIRDRLWLTRMSDDLLAGAISLTVKAVNQFAQGSDLDHAATPPPASGGAPFSLHYPLFLFRGLADRLERRLKRGKRPFYWQVAFRQLHGPGIAETGRLDGPPFTVLPDDGERFYADPFVFEHEGQTCLFVEEFPYATGRGVISVARQNSDGSFGTPVRVLEEAHHLSYPQVFAFEGEVFMLPESAAARELVLYRAERFPHEWVRDTVLLAGRDINDATLLQSDGRFWLVGTERFGFGSASDTMVVFSADHLKGPWKPHFPNPVAIHHSAARPGGALIRSGETIFLPVQDGSERYGGGLALMRLERLDEASVRFSEPQPILPGPAWNRAGIHTLNRAGAIEVVDSAG